MKAIAKVKGKIVFYLNFGATLMSFFYLTLIKHEVVE